jgi:hypothetical protein
MRTTFFGCTLPWQLLAAQDPGPLYLPMSFGEPCGVFCFCACGAGFGVDCGCTFTCAFKDGVSAMIRKHNKDPQPRRGILARMAIILSKLLAGTY